MRDQVLVRLLIQNDLPRDTHHLQLPIEFAQRSFGVIPATTLVDADEHIVRTKCFDQIQHRLVPLGSQDLLVVPVQARNIDSRRLNQDFSCIGFSFGARDTVVRSMSFENSPDEE